MPYASREKSLEYQRRYYQTHKREYTPEQRERARERSRKYYHAHKEKSNARWKEWYKKHQEERKEYSRKYRKAHPEIYKKEYKNRSAEYKARKIKKYVEQRDKRCREDAEYYALLRRRERIRAAKARIAAGKTYTPNMKKRIADWEVKGKPRVVEGMKEISEGEMYANGLRIAWG